MLKKCVLLSLLFCFCSFTRVLVTGGAGFVGSNLIERLLENGTEVICLDDLSTGSKENIDPFLTHPNFCFIEQDVRDSFVSEKPLDAIYNLACAASPKHYQKDPIKTLLTNVQGAYNMAELALRHNAVLFQASTSEVYGDPLTHPQKEDDWGNVNPNGIRACYDEGKRAAEALLFDHHRTFGTKIKIARFFNTYGPKMAPDDGRVVSNFILQALQGVPITLYGTGEQTRSFCYIDDLLDAIDRFMKTADKHLGPINMGNPGEFTMLELAQLTLKLTGSKSELVFLPLPEDDPKKRQPDITKAKQLLNWAPKTPLEEGLKKTILYFQKL